MIFFCKGSFINDITQFLASLPCLPSPSSHFLVQMLQYCRHKIIDLIPPKDITSFMDDSLVKKYYTFLFLLTCFFLHFKRIFTQIVETTV